MQASQCVCEYVYAGHLPPALCLPGLLQLQQTACALQRLSWQMWQKLLHAVIWHRKRYRHPTLLDYKWAPLHQRQASPWNLESLPVLIDLQHRCTSAFAPSLTFCQHPEGNTYALSSCGMPTSSTALQHNKTVLCHCSTIMLHCRHRGCGRTVLCAM